MNMQLRLFTVSNLKLLIKNAGLKNPSLAKLIGCKPVEIWRLAAWPEKGGRKMTPQWASKIAPHIGVKPHELLFESEPTNHVDEFASLRSENKVLMEIIHMLLKALQK